MIIRVKGFKIFKDRHGKVRCYHRKTGHKIDLTTAPLGSAAFMAECAKIEALTKAMEAKQPKPGTLGGLIQFYYETEHYRETLSPRTRSDYRKAGDYLAPIADTPASSIDTPLIAAIHDKATISRGWRQANMLRSFLVEVFRFGKPQGLISENFAVDVIPKPRPKGKVRANRPWTVQELDTVLSLAPGHIRAPIALMANTGLDPSDALALRRDKIDGGVIWAKRGKTGQDVPLPINDRLRRALDDAPTHDAITVLATTRGRPWTYNGFSTVWHRWREKQVKEGHIPADLTLKGLRHTVATILREAGYTPRQVADYLGQKTESMAIHYSRDADMAERNRETASALDQEIERRTKVVKPFLQSVKPEKGQK